MEMNLEKTKVEAELLELKKSHAEYRNLPISRLRNDNYSSTHEKSKVKSLIAS